MDSDKAATSKKLELFIISLLSLYLELVIIRWLSSEIRIFAYFKNVPLMACLFGLGLGMALGMSDKKLARWFPLGLAVIVAIICLADQLNLVHVAFINPLEHYLIGHFVNNLGAEDTPMRRLQLFLPGLGLLVGVFYLIVFTFACMGQRLGALFNEFKPLTGYSINVFAAFVGIALYTIVSFLSLSPIWWLAIGFAFMAFYYRKWHQILAMVVALVMTFFLSPADVRWSPYYRISVAKAEIPADGDHPAFDYGYHINVNYDTIEGAYNNNPEKIAALSEKQRKGTADYYDTPYLALGDKPRSILILAAGTGNDVAAALRHGATDVDAIEIDPTIAQLGRELHPESPYNDPRVHVIVDDARAYIRRTNKKYDLVVFAYLDSHSAFSAMSSLRLDNYVYTEDCFKDAARLVKPDGSMSVTFYYLTWWQLARVYRSLEEGYGAVPIGVYSKMNNGPTLLVGPGVDKQAVQSSGLPMFSLEQFTKENNITLEDWKSVNPTTDDWPYLFLRGRGVSWTYAIGLIFTLYVGWWLVGRCFGKFAGDPMGRTMFFLGAAFMLVETKSVTQMGLLAGTTWIVNSAVIGGVLLMILIANIAQIKFQFKNIKLLYGLLFATLAFNLVFPIGLLNGLDAPLRLATGTIILVAPLLFAAVIFAITFSQVKDPHRALGMNLLGTLIGGALEYFSMMIGISALNAMAAALYGLAMYFYLKQDKVTVDSPQKD
ncbi:MAG: methyltransferase domain-containing protein [Cyanobacteriota/Melainabacteria group bacterium]